MNAPFIIKLGSAVTRDEHGNLDQPALHALIGQCGDLMDRGERLVLVSSGAVAAGHGRLGELRERNPVVRRQLYAAVGQNELMQFYRTAFSSQSREVAQVLATRQDFSTRRHYLNMRECLLGALRAGIVPVVNENDVVAVTELMFTDNDQLAGLLAGMLGASRLLILTNVDGVYDGPPDEPGSRLIRRWDDETQLPAGATQRSEFGRGGIRTKVRSAARLAELGTQVWIANGRRPDIIRQVVSGDAHGTCFPASRRAKPSKRWVAGAPAATASIRVNEGAAQVLRSADRLASLLPVGVEAIEGEFERGDIVKVVDRRDRAVGYGRAEYGAEAARRAMGRQRQRPLIHYDYLFVDSEDE